MLFLSINWLSAKLFLKIATIKPRPREKNKSKIIEISSTLIILGNELSNGRRKINKYNPIFTLYIVSIKIIKLKEYTT